MDSFLVIDTSSYIAMGLLSTQKKAISQRMIPDQKAADVMDRCLEELSADSGGEPNIKKIYVCLGPGSFTGLRIGIAYAEGLAFHREIPIFGYSSLQLMLSLGGENSAMAVIPARRDFFYVSCRNMEGCGQNLETLLSKEEVESLCKKADVLIVPQVQSLPAYAQFLFQYSPLEFLSAYPFEKIPELSNTTREMELGIIKPNYIQKPAAEIARLKKIHD